MQDIFLGRLNSQFPCKLAVVPKWKKYGFPKILCTYTNFYCTILLIALGQFFPKCGFI